MRTVASHVESRDSAADADVCNLFDGLLVPLAITNDNDVQEETASSSRRPQQRAFVVNRRAGGDLCLRLQPDKFMAASGAMQTRILSLMDEGLRAGICSVIRLRLSCESRQIVWCLLELLKELTCRTDAQTNRYTDKSALIQVLSRVLGMVCSAGLEVDELKGLLRELVEPSAMTQPLVEALAVMTAMARSDITANKKKMAATGALNCPAVQSIFNFDGEGAGLVLPTVFWPFAQEYQIVSWVRVEQPARSASLGVHGTKRRAHLVTLTTQMGSGVDYYLEDSRLFVVVADGKRSGHVQTLTTDMGEMGFVGGRWHALVIRHKRSSALMFNKDQLEVCLDEEVVFSACVPYPRHVTEPLTRCSIGWDLDGQTSGVLLLTSAAHPKVVRSMLNRLAGHVDNLSEEALEDGRSAPDLDLWADPASISSQERFRRMLLGSEYRIFAALLPGRTMNGRCLEPHHGIHARLRGDRTHVWTTRLAQDVIGSIGGTPTLLALAHHLLSDAPESSIGRSMTVNSSISSSAAFVGSNVDTVLSVLLSFLDGNVANQDEFVCAGGVEILELLLGSSSGKNFSTAGAHTVMVLERIYQACRLHRVPAAASHRMLDLAKDIAQPRERTSSLEHQILVRLLTNVSLWAKAPPDFQFGLVTSVLDMVREAPERFRQTIPLETVLASIRICCPDRVSGTREAPEDAGSGTSRDADRVIEETTSSAERDWTSMTWRERLHLRDFLWKVMRLLLEKEVDPQDGVALIHFMLSCDDTRLVCELLQTLSSLMRQSVPPAGLFRALESASLVHEEVWRGRAKTESPQASHQTGFLPLVLQRCVLIEGASEGLRAAGLRAANVFMARSAKASERSAPSAPGGTPIDWRGPEDADSGVGTTSFVKPRDSMHFQVSTVFPLLSEGLMRDRHILGEGTYTALLEMVLLGDERELPWSEQAETIGVIHSADSWSGRSSSSRQEMGGRKGSRGFGVDVEQEELADVVRGGGNDRVLDDALLIRNVLPLVLIFQCLPAMANSVQVRSHGDLMLMLKLNVANRQKVVELSHANGDKFWGVWGRCLFLMMAPLFSRRADNMQVELDEHGGEAHDGARKGNYLMVLKLYAILLEHTMAFDDKGYQEIALASSLQHLIPHGRAAARVLLAQLAYEVGQTSTPKLSLEEEQPFLGRQSRPSDFPSACADKESQHIEVRQQPRWNNMVHLAFIAANAVSDDVSTITAGLFPEGDELGSGGVSGGETNFGSDGEAICASAASTSIPFLLCSNPAEHGSVALSARVLGMFKVLSGGPSPALLELCTARSIAPSQGPLLFPLLRLSLFLLVRLHPLSRPAVENLGRLVALVHCLLSDNWRIQAGSDSPASDDMCFVILGHVHAALIRLKAKAITVVGASHGDVSEARVDIPGNGVTDARALPPGSFVDATSAYEIGRTLRDLLQHLTLRRLDLLSARLGEQLTRSLQDATTFEPQYLGVSGERGIGLEKDTNGARLGWDRLLQSLRWMERSSLFTPALDTTMHPSHGVHALLEACMPSLKAAEELESHAVREAGERAQQWQELVNRAAFVGPMGEDNLGLPSAPAVQLEALRQEALKTEALHEMKMGRRLLASHRRLQLYVQTLSAAWSPWAAGDHQQLCTEPPGWEVSSHKDQRMRQMLLVPVDADMGHKDASYAGIPSISGNSAHLVAPEDGVHTNAVLLPPLKPSASLLAGEMGFSDDDEEELEGEEVGGSRPSSPARPQGPEQATLEWEDITRQSASQAEIEAAVQLATNQLAWDDLQPQPMSTKGGDGRVFQNLHGQWAATNVLRQDSVPGTLYLFEASLVFQSDPSASSDGNAEANPSWLMQHAGQRWRWRLERLTQVHLRRFLLSPKAVELFWADSPEVFLAFQNVHDRQAFTRNLRKRNLPMLPVTTQRGTLHPRKVLKASKLTELWRRRQISNFQYIMELNVIAGRSYNDITQYPVFPWVLADYTSNELDLNNPASFRDLSRPMGAVNERRRELFMDRYESFEDETVPKFMYGTHYSSAGVVLHYHVRQDPFTTLHINLQDGRFDCPDRLFDDLGKCWAGCIDENNMSDVKELTPEFFYCPEIFLNSNKLPLGEMQDGMGVVDDVRLPPWARDAFDFVRIHRLALESEQVSQHLHQWIDLVFGYKQRGNEAVKAANVFYYLTYEGAVDLSLVDDAHQRDAMEAQIRHFGQTPSQILMEPHPVRLPPEECVLPLFSATSALTSLRVFSPTHKLRNTFRAAVLLVYCTEDRLVRVDASLRVTTWTWSGLPNGRGLPFTLGLSRTNSLPSRLLHMSNVSTKTSLASGRLPMGSSNREVTAVGPARIMGSMHSCFGLHSGSEANSESILSCGYWDHVVRLHHVDSTVKLPLGGCGTGGHRGAITCLAIADGSSLLVTGGEDATCRVWVVSNAPMASALGGSGACGANATNRASSGDDMVCVHVLYGHEAPLTCLAVSEELDAVVSGARDGRIVLHCLKDGRYVRQYRCGAIAAGYKGDPAPEASQLVFSCHGEVVAHSWTDLSLHRFSLNGVRLATAIAPVAMSCLLTAGGGEYLLTGGNDGLIRVYTLHNLCVLHTLDLQNHGGVTCMRLSPNDEYLLAGSEDGEVSIITDARKRLRMLDLALRRAFVG